jgi:hypothetical protein
MLAVKSFHKFIATPYLIFNKDVNITADTKVTPASIFRFIWIPLLHNIVKHVRNRTARFRCVFEGTDDYEV